jgi:hypothetical protein
MSPARTFAAIAMNDNPYAPPASALSNQPTSTLGGHDGKVLRLEYPLTFGDYWLFNIIHQFLSFTVQFFLLLGAGTIVLISIKKSGVLASLFAGGVVYIILCLVQMFALVCTLYSRKNKAVLTGHILEVQDAALYDETPFYRSYYYWTSIAKVVSRPGFVAVYVAAHSALIIPTRTFSSHEQRTAFVSLVKARAKAAATAPSPRAG